MNTKYQDVLERFIKQYDENAYDFFVYNKRRVEIIDKHGNVLKCVSYRAFEKFVYETLSGLKYSVGGK